MVINGHDGEPIIGINFNSGLTILPDDAQLTVTGKNASGESFTLSYPLKEIGGWNFTETAADEIPGDKVLAVEAIREDLPLTVTLIGDGVKISPLRAESHIAVCDTAGRVTYSATLSDSAVIIPLSSLTRGVNILTVNDRSLKFTVNQ